MPITASATSLALFQNCEAQRRLYPDKVFLIYRFDNDDTKMGAVWSTGYYNDPSTYFYLGMPLLYPVRYTEARRVRDQPGLSRLTDSAEQSGGHAEEYFIRQLPILFALHGVPGEIDLYISRIPCADRSQLWTLEHPVTGEMVLFPKGCAAKLRKIMRMTPNIEWRLAYMEGYPNPNTQANCLAGIRRMNDLPNVHAGHASEMVS
jgi:hypothetical protein